MRLEIYGLFWICCLDKRILVCGVRDFDVVLSLLSVAVWIVSFSTDLYFLSFDCMNRLSLFRLPMALLRLPNHDTTILACGKKRHFILLSHDSDAVMNQLYRL